MPRRGLLAGAGSANREDPRDVRRARDERDRLGRGEGYRYAHDEPGGVSDQPLLPEELRGRRFYAPTDRGFEQDLGRRLEELRKKLDNL